MEFEFIFQLTRYGGCFYLSKRCGRLFLVDRIMVYISSVIRSYNFFRQYIQKKSSAVQLALLFLFVYKGIPIRTVYFNKGVDLFSL